MLLTTGILAAGIVATAIGATAASNNEDEGYILELETRADQTTQAIQRKLDSAEQRVRSLEGLFAAGPVDRMAFNQFIVGTGEVVGTQAVGYARHLAATERETFELAVQADETLVKGGYPEFVVTPDPTHADMFVVDFIEPMAGNDAAFGFDLGSNDARRAAIEKARDTGETVSTEGIILVQDEQSRFGFLLMRPVYQGGEIPATVEDRQNSFHGIVDGVFIVDQLVADIAAIGSSLDIAIRDAGYVGETNGVGTVLFNSSKSSDDERGAHRYSVDRIVTVGDRTWAVTATDLNAHSSSLGALPNVLWITGLLLSVAFAITAYTTTRSRDRAKLAAHNATIELQSQADELRQARDKALDADRIKTTFLATMSHELRTPLNAVIGLSSVLTNEVFGPLSEKQMNYMERITTSGDHLLHLIDDLLALARIEAGRDELNIEYLDLDDEINSSLDIVRSWADEAGIALRRPKPNSGVVIAADRRRFRQILLNLATNAVKFTPHGGEVGVDLVVKEGVAEIAVWDTGIGISEDDMDNIFEPFFQSDSGLSRSRDGSGLGLALTKQLIQLHDASINVESSREGSRFIVSWAVAKESATTLPRRRKAGRRTISLTGTRVLLAEDSDASRVLMRDLLETAGCEVIEASDGRQAIDLALAELPDLVVLDIQLPIVNGLDVARIIKSDVKAGATPILAATAMAMPNDRKLIEASGCEGYLTKPFTQDEFYQAVDSVLRQPVGV